MGYLRCEACGAKALAAASQCPSCLQLFDRDDAGGRRVALRRCRGCDILHRVDRPCHWCGDAPVVSSTPWAARMAAVAAVAGLLWVGASLGGGRAPELARSVAVDGADSSARQAATRAATANGQDASARQVVTRAETEELVLDLARPSDHASGASTPPDSGATWQPAVARTWVNVRSDASLEGEVVGVVRPDSRALLGAERHGWRRITHDGVSGWVDPRLFASASAGS